MPFFKCEVLMKTEKSFVTYEEFGAVGNGIHDDLPAIVACHDYANANHIPVRAQDGAEYYIGGKAIFARVTTDTDFGTAKFIIDDRRLEDHSVYCFEVESDFEEYVPEITSIKAGQKKIDFSHRGKTFVRVYGDERERVYIRKGLNMNAGDVPVECFVVDEDGNVLNDINWDYTNISKITAKCVDDEPITISGGIFTTVANQWICEYASHKRGIRITRSNVTVKNIQHYITGELSDHGAPYSGFITIFKNYNTTFYDSTLTPHRTYQMESKVPGKQVSMGTYDLSMTFALNVTLKNLKQSRPLDALEFWGIMGTNFCKDVTILDCEISRFDAHCGVTNCTIRRSRFGYAGLNLIGFGKFILEDSYVNAPQMLTLRSDYGSSFNGEVIIKNCVWRPLFNRNLNVIFAYNSADHYFGYDSVMSKSIEIDGLTIDDAHIDEDKTLCVLPDYDASFEKDKPHKYILPEKITIKNTKALSGRTILPFLKPEQYEGVVFKLL